MGKASTILLYLALITITVISYFILDSNTPAAPVSKEEIEKDGGSVFVLPDGRILEYFDVHKGKVQEGEEEPVVVSFHGGLMTGSFAAKDPTVTNPSRIISPTMPGFGGSSSHPGRSIASYGQDVKHLLDHLQIKKYYLIGASWGGIHALSLAQTAPEQVAGVFLVAPAMPTFPDFEGWTVSTKDALIFHTLLPMPYLGPALIRFGVKPGTEGNPEQLIKNFGFSPFEGYEVFLEDMRRSIRYNLHGMPDLQATSIKKIEHLDLPGLGGKLKKIPITIIHGKQDVTVTLPNSEYLVRKLKEGGHENVKLEVLEGAHELCFETARRAGGIFANASKN